jgi:hypothetical protein
MVASRPSQRGASAGGGGGLPAAGGAAGTAGISCMVISRPSQGSVDGDEGAVVDTEEKGDRAGGAAGPAGISCMVASRPIQGAAPGEPSPAGAGEGATGVEGPPGICRSATSRPLKACGGCWLGGVPGARDAGWTGAEAGGGAAACRPMPSSTTAGGGCGVWDLGRGRMVRTREVTPAGLPSSGASLRRFGALTGTGVVGNGVCSRAKGSRSAVNSPKGRASSSPLRTTPSPSSSGSIAKGSRNGGLSSVAIEEIPAVVQRLKRSGTHGRRCRPVHAKPLFENATGFMPHHEPAKAIRPGERWRPNRLLRKQLSLRWNS